MEGDHEGDWRGAIQQSAREDLSNIGSVDGYVNKNQESDSRGNPDAAV